MRKNNKIHLLYVDRSQILHNCFIAQLHKVLCQNYELSYISINELQSGNYTPPKFGEIIFSVLKQRLWRRNIPFLARLAENSKLVMYDQDPWEAYHDRASSPGVYKNLYELVPVSRFLVTSGWWANYIRELDNLPVKFVRMGVLSQNCKLGKPFEKRAYPLAFKGSIHKHRQDYFDFMRSKGHVVKCLPSGTYRQFLSDIEEIGIFVHDEHADVKINNVLSYNGIWIKDIEVAAKGCFSMRNADFDMINYSINEIPTIYTYDCLENAPGVIDKILSIPPTVKKEMMGHSVETIRQRNDWMTVIKELKKL